MVLKAAASALDLARLRQAIRRAWQNIELPLPRGMANDYSEIAKNVAALSGSWQSQTVSVIVPVYNRKTILARTLAGLTLQSYPKNLIEVIIADDGSDDHPEDLLKDFSSELNISIVRQNHCGYRLAEVRNFAISKSSAQIIISLDCDMLPNPNLVESFARWFHASDFPLLVIGYRRFIEADSLTPEAIRQSFKVVTDLPPAFGPWTARTKSQPTKDWREREFKRSAGLKHHPQPFTLASGGNVAFRRRDIVSIGYYSQDFNMWGGEDQDMAYRLGLWGAYFIPEPKAYAFHQAHPIPEDRPMDRTLSQRLLAQKVPYYRYLAPGEIYPTPRVSVFMPTYNAKKWIAQAIDSALEQKPNDLEVCICDYGPDDGTCDFLSERYGKNSRLTWVRTENLDKASACRRAIELCQGEFLLQLEAEDQLLPGAVKSLLTIIEKDDRIALVYGGYARVGLSGETISQHPGKAFSRSGQVTSNLVPAPRMFRARDYHRTAGFSNQFPLALDFDLYSRLAERGLVKHTTKILYLERQRLASHSQTQAQAIAQDQRRVVKSNLARLGLPFALKVDGDSIAPHYTLKLKCGFGMLLSNLKSQIRLRCQIPIWREVLKPAARQAFRKFKTRRFFGRRL